MAAVFLLGWALGCNEPVPVYYSHDFVDQFSGLLAYSVHPDAITPEGISVDTSGLNIDLGAIDKQVDEVEACLANVFGDPPTIPADVASPTSAWCDSTTFPLPVVRKWLTIKIAADWVESCYDPNQQLLPSPAPAELCEAKGIVVTDGCPCLWRAGIQENRYIVVTPNLFLLKDPLIRMVTGCDMPWVSPLSTCATPDTSP